MEELHQARSFFYQQAFSLLFKPFLLTTTKTSIVIVRVLKNVFLQMGLCVSESVGM